MDNRAHKYLRRIDTGKRKPPGGVIYRYIYEDAKGRQHEVDEDEHKQRQQQAATKDTETRDREVVRGILSRLPEGFEVSAGNKAWSKDEDGKWASPAAGLRLSDEGLLGELVAAQEKADKRPRQELLSGLRLALVAFVQGFVPGQDPKWRAEFDKAQGKGQSPAAKLLARLDLPRGFDAQTATEAQRREAAQSLDGALLEDSPASDTISRQRAAALISRPGFDPDAAALLAGSLAQNPKGLARAEGLALAAENFARDWRAKIEEKNRAAQKQADEALPDLSEDAEVELDDADLKEVPQKQPKAPKPPKIPKIPKTPKATNTTPRVTSAHADLAAKLAQAGTYPEAAAQIGAKAEKELAELAGLLEQAKKDPSKGAEYLRQAAASRFAQQIYALSVAWPGQADKSTDDARELLGSAAAFDPSRPKTYGADTTLYVAGEGGAPVAVKGRYRLVEAADLVASHDPDSFAKNGAYPEGLQERAYHTDKAEQLKVSQNAQGLIPALVANTNPDAVNGPPIILPSGVALGGNSRTMSMQRAYRQGLDSAKALRAHLETHAHSFGLTPEEVKGMAAPVLVREIEPPDQSDDGLRLVVRQLNESFTNALDPRTYAVALARRSGQALTESLAASMEPHETLRSWLDSPASASFRAQLDSAGIIDRRSAAKYKDPKTGKLNRDGKGLVEQVLVGHLTEDPDLLARLPAQSVEALARSAPYVAQINAAGPAYNMREPLRTALDAYATLAHHASQGNISKMSAKMDDEQMNAALGHLKSATLFDEPHRVFSDPRAMGLLKLMMRRPGTQQLATSLREVAQTVAQNPEGQSSLFGAVDPNRVLQDALTKHSRPTDEEDEPTAAAA